MLAATVAWTCAWLWLQWQSCDAVFGDAPHRIFFLSQTTFLTQAAKTDGM